MFLIVGLGNPGEKYNNTWHNMGFMALDVLIKRSGLPDFKASKKIKAEVSEGYLPKEKIILAKPLAFMNNSGFPVKLLMQNWKIKPANLIVIHDDIDLPVGRIKMVKNRGAAGHNGVESIIKAIKTKDFLRVRIGIQPASGKPRNPEKFVLQKFNKKESENVQRVIKKTAKALEFLLEEGAGRAMSKYNK